MALQSNLTDGQWQFRSAVQRGDIDEMQRLVDGGVDPFYRFSNAEGDTCLHDVIYSENVDALAWLLQLPGMDVNVQGNEGRPPLYIAVVNKNEKMIEALLNHGADPDLRDHKGSTPTLQSLFRARSTWVLLEAGGDPNVVTHAGVSVHHRLEKFPPRDDRRVTLEHHVQAPMIDADGPALAARLRQPENGALADAFYYARHWRQWGEMVHTLQAQGAASALPTKEELLTTGDGQEFPPIYYAILARKMGSVVAGLNARGEGLSIQDLQQDTMVFEAAIRYHAVEALYNKENLMQLSYNDASDMVRNAPPVLRDVLPLHQLQVAVGQMAHHVQQGRG